MIKEIARSGAEVAYVECPTLEGNGQAEFALLVPFAMQRKECLTEGWIIHGDERRRLIVAAIKSAKNPVQMRNLNRRADARISGVLAHTYAASRRQDHRRSSVMCQTQAAVESEPVRRFVLFFKKNRLDVSPGSGSCGANVVARINS